MSMQREKDSSIVAFVFLPPPCVGDELVGVVVGEVVEIVVGNLDGEPVCGGAGG
jgi:hypothetical protein